LAEVVCIQNFVAKLSTAAHEIAQATVRARFQADLKELRLKDSIPVIVNKIASLYDLKPESAKLYFNLFIKSGCLGLQADGRGTWQRESFLEKWDLSPKFDTYLKFVKLKDLSCLNCKEYINTELRKKFPANHDIHLEPPLSKSTVHKIMLSHGCIFKATSKVSQLSFFSFQTIIKFIL
jgi:hypothetical protein